jgi:hypothetical protein
MHFGRRSNRRAVPASAAFAALLAAAIPATAAPTITSFTAGDLVLSVYGDGDGSGVYADNSASPITLQEVTTSGAQVGQLVLPQTTAASGGVTNYAISGEYGSSSEGTLELSQNGKYLTIAGYGVSASAFNNNPQSYGGATKSCINVPNVSTVTCYPLAQTASVANTPGSTGSGVATATVVPRVIALVGANGSVDTSTALTGVFNENNPRSVATVDGSSFYISGQGASKTDTTTQGLFYAPRGATTATPIDTSFDTRTVEINNNQLYLSADSTEGSGVHENISSYGGLPTTAASASVLQNISSKFTVSSLSQLNGIDQTLGTNPAFTTASKTKGIVYLSPENFFFASATVLYVADSGAPKGDNNGSGSSAQGVSDGGLQKWSLVSGKWVLDYTLSAGLNLVPDTAPCAANAVGCGTTGLIGLTGEVIGNRVELFATNSTLGDEDPTYLYGINDLLSSVTLPVNETFSVLDTAAPDTNIRGVAFAPTPVPEASSLALFLSMLGLFGFTRRRGMRRRAGIQSQRAV